MRIYIDFEATETEKVIISVGCLAEDGEQFYSLVHCDDMITSRIEEITGISQQDIDNAPSASEVCSRLYDWSSRDGQLPEFICYGNGDYDFVYNTFQLATGMKEASILGYLYLNMYDCSEDFKQFFYVNKTISLEKLAHHFDENVGDQNHNALDDARLLKLVYEGMENGTGNLNEFREYLAPSRVPSAISKIVRIGGNTILNEFSSMEEAVEWVRSNSREKGASYSNNAEEKIKTAARNGSKYFGSNWRIL